jgi:quercetin dioxygenase-like cupin family protein
MATITIAKRNDSLLKPTKGGPNVGILLPNQCQGLTVRRSILRARHDYSPEIYPRRNQIFFFAKGEGFIATPRTAYNIDAQAVFVPQFDRDEFFIRAASDLEFLEILLDLTAQDVSRLQQFRLSLPYFLPQSRFERYEEAFKGPDTISRSVIGNRKLARSSMGTTYSRGPHGVGEHAHQDLEQFIYGLEGSCFTFEAEGERALVQEGDFVHIPPKARHKVLCDEGKIVNYVWYEIENQA